MSGRRGRGFALVLTVTLLSFLVLVLVGLATYTRVETAVTSSMVRQSQARENALFALNVALGQLQQHAGPDRRATATAEGFPNRAGTTRYVGVWPSDQAADDDGDPLTPLTWLVSGNESRGPGGEPQPRAITPTTVTNTNNGVALVSTNTSRVANDVLARLVDIRAPGVPGVAPGVLTPIGRYAWWVGDQGVKAPVAVPDTSTTPTYAPYDTADARSRIRQQITVGAGAANSSGTVAFEPRDNNNSGLVSGHKIFQPAQFAFLRNSANAQLGLTTAQQNFHTWSPNNWAVIADTKYGGLRRDLSLAPELLGDAFVAWTNYSAYMETPVTPLEPSESGPPAISPAYGSDPLRRRHLMTPHLRDGTGSHQVAPVVTYFMITFNVRTVSNKAGVWPLEVRARWMVSLWNPYTSALVPEDLRLEVTGLPYSVRVVNDNVNRGGMVGSFSLGSSYGMPMRINLPWTPTTTPDRQSWLPGRVYSWRSKDDSTKSDEPPEDGFASDFYSQTLDDGGAGVIRPLNLAEVDASDDCHLEVDGSESLELTLYVMRPEGPVRLAGLTSPMFVQNFSTTPQLAKQNEYQFSYVFRLAESIDTPEAPGTWMTTPGRDVRRFTLPSESYVVAENGNDPSQYGGSYKTIRNPSRLLDRATNSYTYNEDVPVFELPRAPLLSLGALQHFRQPGQRPFMIGNPWGAAYTLNGMRTAELFDRFFFSGLTADVTPSTNSLGELVLPNPLLKALRKPNAADFRAAPEARSSKFLLQGGAFNLNSVNVAAWAAVLRGVRFPSPQTFSYLNASSSTGTNGDTSKSTVQSGDAQFFRFSQSAQETYKAEVDQSAPGETDITPPSTNLFRRGMRTLTTAQVGVLAAKIVEYVKAKQAQDGPFRTLDEFLSPNALYLGGVLGNERSLLEAAIEDAKTSDEKTINTDMAEFGATMGVQMNSQWLTQADIMTALAPVLFPRSDTFIVRAYGEVINPATNVVEGRAWCEAMVQRVPEYLDAGTDAPEIMPDLLASTVNQVNGRRFKVVSFRWLTRTDL